MVGLSTGVKSRVFYSRWLGQVRGKGQWVVRVVSGKVLGGKGCWVVRGSGW